MRELDVIMVSDFRLPGGTNHSTAQELSVHKQMGISTGLIQSNSRLSSRALPWSKMITREISPHQVDPILPGTPIHAQVALLRHPIAAGSMPDLSSHVRVEHALIIANQAAIGADGKIEYDVSEITETVQNRLGATPTWAPIGPVVRKSLETQTDAIRILPFDWTNIFSQDSAPPERTGFDSERPRIGRHSRPQPAKWPDSAREILQAYPASSDYDVRILGGAKPAIEAIGKPPPNWTVYPFGSVDPMDFLQGVDFWVYFHHSGTSEAYGRAIMEALWSGAVAILPEYLRVTFGDAAVYGKPSDTQAIIQTFCSGERDFIQQSKLGQNFARAHAPGIHVGRMRELLSRTPSQGAQSDEVSLASQSPALTPAQVNLTTSSPDPLNRFDSNQKPRALFVTSNGAGMGHMTRMLGIARASAKYIDPVFFSMSQGVGVARTAGFPYEYVPFNSSMKTKTALWHRYFEDRLLAAIDHHDAQIVLFDGTWPYRGMLAALRARDVLTVWVRRGMWKANISPEQLSNAQHFDLVIEPGEHAHEYDTGATTQVQGANVVAPITVLSSSEILSREAALKGLGLPNRTNSKYALVTLGAGNINNVSSTQSEVTEAIRSHSGWEPILTKAPISAALQSASARSVSTFPLAKYTRAFDFAISAAGYNSFAEWMVGALPSIWIPNMSTKTDDQDARARWAADAGYGLRASGSNTDEIRAAVDLMCDASYRAPIEHRLAALNRTNGAEEAADLIFEAWEMRQHGKGILL